MKTYFVDKIRDEKVNFTANNLSELVSIAIRHAECNGGGLGRIYVHCSHVVSKQKDEQNVEYIVSVNNRARTISAKRI